MSSNIVKRGYEKVADDYASKRNQFESIKYLEMFIPLVEKGKTILDIGCGAGRPVDEFLVRHGYAVNGVDISERMIELAKQNVPQGFFEVKDMTKLKEGEYCVDGIVSFYAIFHTPRQQHQKLLSTFASFMPKGGALLITMGAEEWEGTENDFHGSKMFWSHYGAEKNKEMLEKAGFEIVMSTIDTSGGEKHQVILAKLD